MTAPLFADLAQGPADGFAEWATAADGRQIRVAAFGLTAAKGTVFLFPGRTEYIEKYGQTAARLLLLGYATVSLDWRGQGLASRTMADPLPGHVAHFAEFQLDVAALLAFARARGLPEPYFLLAHSMGGCIGLRSLLAPHAFQAAAFSAPMWGIQMPAWQRPFAPALARLACTIGQPLGYAPGTGPTTYVTSAAFQGNTLTNDPAMWDYMAGQVRAQPSLALGGPTMAWLNAALQECAALARLPSPRLPALVGFGTQERVVDPAPIRARMGAWAGGALVVVEGAQHELLMEKDRFSFLDQVAALFDRAGVAGQNVVNAS